MRHTVPTAPMREDNMFMSCTTTAEVRLSPCTPTTALRLQSCHLRTLTIVNVDHDSDGSPVKLLGKLDEATLPNHLWVELVVLLETAHRLCALSDTSLGPSLSDPLYLTLPSMSTSCIIIYIAYPLVLILPAWRKGLVIEPTGTSVEGYHVSGRQVDGPSVSTMDPQEYSRLV